MKFSVCFECLHEANLMVQSLALVCVNSHSTHDTRHLFVARAGFKPCVRCSTLKKMHDVVFFRTKGILKNFLPPSAQVFSKKKWFLCGLVNFFFPQKKFGKKKHKNVGVFCSFSNQPYLLQPKQVAWGPCSVLVRLKQRHTPSKVRPDINYTRKKTSNGPHIKFLYLNKSSFFKVKIFLRACGAIDKKHFFSKNTKKMF